MVALRRPAWSHPALESRVLSAQGALVPPGCSAAACILLCCMAPANKLRCCAVCYPTTPLHLKAVWLQNQPLLQCNEIHALLQYEPLGKKPAGWAPETAEWRPVAPVKQRKQSRNWLCSFFALPKAVESARFHP